MTEDPSYRAGQALGDAIIACFEAIAKIDGITREEAIDEWVSTYVTERIIEER
jgi:hypothetical protein